MIIVVNKIESYFCCILFFIIISSCKNLKENPLKTVIVSVEKIKTPHFNKIQGFSLEDFRIDSNRVKAGGNLSQILQELNVSYDKIYSLGNNFKSVFDIRKIYPGDKYYILKTKDSSKLSKLIYQRSITENIIMSFLDTLNVELVKKPVEIRTLTAVGTIQSSLWNSFIKNNLPPALVSKVATLYSWTIDFFDIQKNDNYKIIYEAKYVDNQFIGVGKIKAILFNHKGKDFYAFSYLRHGGKIKNYFNENGESLQKALLSAPLEYVRISSKFSHKR